MVGKRRLDNGIVELGICGWTYWIACHVGRFSRVHDECNGWIFMVYLIRTLHAVLW
jgi:hypothetical protein